MEEQTRQEKLRRQEKKKRRGRLRRFFSRASFDQGPYVAYASSVLRSLEARTHVSDPDTEALAEGAGLGRFNRLLQRYLDAVEGYWETASDRSAAHDDKLRQERKVDELRQGLEYSDERTAQLERNLLRAVDRWGELRHWARTPAQRWDARTEVSDNAFLTALEAGHLDREE